MATYRARVSSQLPPAEVFDYMARFSNAAEWDPGVIEADEDGGGLPGPALGSSFRLMVRSVGRAIPLEYRIVEFDRPRRVVLRAENSIVRSTDVISVVPGPGTGSTITYDAKLQLKGAAALFTPMLGLWLRRIGDRAVVGLRATLEA
jgi:Polyketide cyclase / dehydrase and lipid transport